MKNTRLKLINIATLVILFGLVVLFLLSDLCACLSYKYDVETPFLEKEFYSHLAERHMEYEIFISLIGCAGVLLVICLLFIGHRIRRTGPRP